MEPLMINCKVCLLEWQAMNPMLRPSVQEYARLEVSLSKDAHLKVSCVRHNMAVLSTNDLESTAEKAYNMGCALCREGGGHNH